MSGLPTEVSFNSLRSWFESYRKGLVVLYGNAAVNSLAQKLLALPLFKGERVTVLDAGNLFDPYLFTSITRRLGGEPREVLRRIIVSRSFTCHQTHALVDRALRLDPKFSRVILVLGLLNTFYDEEVPEHERRTLLKKTTALLKRISERGSKVLVSSAPPPVPVKGGFPALLFGAADLTVALEANQDGALSLRRLVPTQEAVQRRV